MSLPKQRILNTATLLFHQQGYNNTGINQIISDAKVAKASFYQHFKSKEDLCICFLNYRHNFWFSQLKNFVENCSTPREKILSSFDFLIDINYQEDFRGCSFLNILSEITIEQKEVLTVIQNHKKDLQNFFSEIIEDKLTATHLYLLFEGAIIESQLFKSNEIVVQCKKIIQSILKNQ